MNAINIAGVEITPTLRIAMTRAALLVEDSIGRQMTTPELDALICAFVRRFSEPRASARLQ